MIELGPAPATLPHGRRVYAIGDIHGCDAQLATLHATIAQDLAHRPVVSPLLLHIGDYVDRGPDTAAVITRLLRGSPLPGVPMVNLLGNHEHTMLEALSGERAAATDWLFTGGRPALESYGVDPDSPRETWPDAVPPAHLDFLRMRQPFLYSEASFGAVVVHGHTPVKAPVVRHNRIAIDTGAVFGGKLTCVVLEGETIGFLTADPVGEPVPIAH